MRGEATDNMDAVRFAFKMLPHQKEMQEFRVGLQAIAPIMTDPDETREAKRSALNMMVNELSDKAFSLKPIVVQIFTIINMKEDVCREYADSEAQVEGILGWLPRMREHHDMLLAEVRKHRHEYQLKL